MECYEDGTPQLIVTGLMLTEHVSWKVHDLLHDLLTFALGPKIEGSCLCYLDTHRDEI